MKISPAAARKWGVVIVLAAHNWRAKDVSRGLFAMFRQPGCFRVADDTSGAVALNSRRWGKQAMKLRQPGRGILLLDGRYQVFQAYRLSPEQERQGLAIKVDLSPLSELERSLVTYALDQMDGRFVVNKLAAAFAAGGDFAPGQNPIPELGAPRLVDQPATCHRCPPRHTGIALFSGVFSHRRTGSTGAHRRA